MKARIIASKTTTGTVAKDYIKLVESQRRVPTTLIRPDVLPAQQVLQVFEDHNRPLPADPAPPVKKLIKVLTHDMQGLPGLLVYGDGKEIGARLFKGCSVRLLGLPDRRFIVLEIYWDSEEVRLQEVGQNSFYTVPWDCVEFWG